MKNMKNVWKTFEKKQTSTYEKRLKKNRPLLITLTYEKNDTKIKHMRYGKKNK